MKIIKAILPTVFLLFIIGTIGALDIQSYQFLNHLVNLNASGAPEVFDDGILFTAPASYRKVGIAFAHEGFAKIYWFQKLLVPDGNPKPQPEESKIGPPVEYADSGILFYAYTVPEGLSSLEYRLVINGLWTIDPANPNKRIDESGIARSLAPMPTVQKPKQVQDTPARTLSFRYTGAPGEVVYVAGSFNNWDPFMYELQEKSPGNYSLTLPLPPGVYQYAYYIRGERVLDPSNPVKVYRDKRPVSQAEVR
jgi:hypothetical protein